MRIVTIFTAAFLLFTISIASDAENKFGIKGQAAPAWDATEWLNLSDGKTKLNVEDYKGKVVYLTFFQSMCGACIQHGLPTLKDSIDRFDESEEVAFIAIQTAFERFDKNNLDGAKKTAKEFGLSIPVGHQGSLDKPAPILWSYDAGGTPWTVIIDKKGIVRFNNYKISSDQAQVIIDELLAEKP